jgi:hypothetical protein
LIALAASAGAQAQSGQLSVPQSINAAASLSIPTSGSGPAELYIVGPDQVLRKNVQLGQTVSLAPGALHNAGRYLVILASAGSTDTGVLTVVPVDKPDALSFLAEPSRLPVSLHNGISGTAYIFDAYRNLITTPASVLFELSNPTGGAQKITATSHNGVAWTQMNSAPREGNAKFVASVDGVLSTRVIDEVPGDPCNLTVSAKPASGPEKGKLSLQTAPVRDCSGNAIPDGTIVTFTEALNGVQSTADVPIKRGVATVEMPALQGATISVASGDVAGNQIRWSGRP